MDEIVPAAIRPPTTWIQLSPPERVVHGAGKLGLHPTDVQHISAAIKAESFSWEQTINLAQRHWVLPLLAKNLWTLPELRSLVPPGVERILELAQFGARARTRAILDSFEPVARALAARGVAFAFMKGAALCHTVYPPGTRLLNDIDVLVQRTDYPAVKTALTSHGFHPALENGESEAERLAQSHQVSFVRPWTSQGTLVVDLHWRMHGCLGLFVDTTELLDRAQKPVSDASTGLVLAAEDIFVHYATQLVVDFLHTNALRLADLQALASRSLHWRLLADVALRSGAAGPTFVALRLAADRGAAVPDEVFADLARSCPGCQEVAEVLRDPRWPFGRWRLSRSAKHMLLYCLHADPITRSSPGAANPPRRMFWTRLCAALRAQRLRTTGTLFRGATWAARMFAARWVSRMGAAGLAGRLRGSFWRLGEDHLSRQGAPLAAVEPSWGVSAVVRQ